MKEVIFKKDGKEEKAYVKQAAGYNDGYYWDCSATVIFNDTEYSIQDAGSGSGYVPHYRSISSNGPYKLVSIMQLCENDNFEDNEEEWEYIEGVIIGLLETFFDEGCKESYAECEGDDSWYLEIYIDGVKQEESTEA